MTRTTLAARMLAEFMAMGRPGPRSLRLPPIKRPDPERQAAAEAERARRRERNLRNLRNLGPSH